MRQKLTEEQRKANKLETQRKYREANREKLKGASKKYYEENKETYQQNRDANKDTIKEKHKLYYQKNKEVIKEKVKEYTKNNIDKVRLAQKNWRKKKLEIDILYRLSYNFSKKLRKLIKRNGHTKKDKTIDILGCTFQEFKQHIESLWQPWMNWDNYGLYDGSLDYGWDIDHIEPISSANTEEELIKLNHYTNLQPLCGFINRNVKKDNPIL
jgi:hypothetical protein